MANVVTETTTGDSTAPAPAESAATSTPSSPTVVTDASSSTSEALAQSASAQTIATQRESPVDPRVVSLRAMFPDYDDAILQSVLESVNWNEDRAVDTLLLMSDPDYKPETQPQERQEGPGLSQEELDEQFARQLLLHDQQKHSRRTAAQLQGAPPGSGPGAQSYRGPPGQPPYPAQPPQRQNSQGAELQDQFNKFAESGKKTFGSLFQKVKTKIQEFEQGRSSQAPSQQYYVPAPASYYGPPHPNLPPPATQYNPNSYPATGQPTSPRPHSTSTSPPPKSNSPTITTATAAFPTQQNKALPSAGPSSPQPIDGGKFGLLPKKPISLIRDESTSGGEVTSGVGASGAQKPATKGYVVDDDDEDGGLEYTENPFDEPQQKK